MTAPSYEQMQGMFRAHTEAALKVIVEIMTGSGGKGDAVRLSAAKEILSRAWGKPASREKAVPENKTGQAQDGEEKRRAADEASAGEMSAPGVAAMPQAKAPAPWFRAAPSPAAAKPPARDAVENRARRAASGG